MEFKRQIVESFNPPFNTQVLWFKDGNIRYFRNNSWEYANKDLIKDSTSVHSARELVEEAVSNRLETFAQKSDIKTRTSELVNDAGFLSKHQDISDKVNRVEVYLKKDIDDKISYILKSIGALGGSFYYTKTEIDDKGYLIRQDLDSYATNSTVSTKLDINVFNHFKNNLSSVAISGDYNDLKNKPDYTTEEWVKAQEYLKKEDISNKVNIDAIYDKSQIDQKIVQLQKENDKFIVLSKEEYDAIESPSDKIFYYIYEEE